MVSSWIPAIISSNISNPAILYSTSGSLCPYACNPIPWRSWSISSIWSIHLRSITFSNTTRSSSRNCSISGNSVSLASYKSTACSFRCCFNSLTSLISSIFFSVTGSRGITGRRISFNSFKFHSSRGISFEIQVSTDFSTCSWIILKIASRMLSPFNTDIRSL